MDFHASNETSPRIEFLTNVFRIPTLGACEIGAIVRLARRTEPSTVRLLNRAERIPETTYINRQAKLPRILLRATTTLESHHGIRGDATKL